METNEMMQYIDTLTDLRNSAMDVMARNDEIIEATDILLLFLLRKIDENESSSSERGQDN